MEGLSSNCHHQGPPKTVKAIAAHGKTEAPPAQRTRETDEEAQRGVLEGASLDRKRPSWETRNLNQTWAAVDGDEPGWASSRDEW